MDTEKAGLNLRYHGKIIFKSNVLIRTENGEFAPGRLDIKWDIDEADESGIRVIIEEDSCGKVEQRIRLSLIHPKPTWKMKLRGNVFASEQAFPAETRTMAQTRFPYIRNTVGLSRNLRNNAVYDRKWDWVLIGPGNGTTRIAPNKAGGEQTGFSFDINDNSFELVFRPRFYQKHKNLHYFEPWTYDVWKKSVTGWCSWWPYKKGFSRDDLEKVVTVFTEKNLPEYGYRYIQIDDAFQRPEGTPESWLSWNEKWPGGMPGAVKFIKEHGFDPSIWVYSYFRDDSTVKHHPNWFVPGDDGEPMNVRYLKYGIDTTNPETVEHLIRPTFAGFKKAGFEYIKADGVRHLIYDAYNHCPYYLRQKGWTPGQAVRKYIQTVREEVGPDVYILSCWGVMPEAIGLADGCRLGGDGYGWSTLHYYNSWNGVVWRNDPDHCDILPDKKGEYLGVVDGKHRTQYIPMEGDIRDTIIRPAFASFAGAVLLLSDRAEVYQNDAYLEGAKRSAPVLFTVPGQLYDFFPEKSSLMMTHKRTEIKTGQGPRLIDAPRWAGTSPFWMLEIDRPFENWSVLARFNWNEFELPATGVRFSDLGLSPENEYLVYEFWGTQFVGVFNDEFPVAATGPREVRMYAIRTKLDRPQILSTNRHISHGCVDLIEVIWNEKESVLSGKSKVVKNDRYTVMLFVPDGFDLTKAVMDGKITGIEQNGRIFSIGVTPQKTTTIDWSFSFGH